jgi:hypothetical protein
MSCALDAADGKALQERLVRLNGSAADVEHSKAKLCRAVFTSTSTFAHRIFNSFGDYKARSTKSNTPALSRMIGSRQRRSSKRCPSYGRRWRRSRPVSTAWTE